MAFERRSYSGAGVSTTLTGSIIAGDTTLSIAASTSWPTGGSGPFFICIDRGTASEEIVKIATRSSLTLTCAGSGRGADGSTATSHASGAAVELVFTATDADEANAHYANAQADPHPMYTTAAELAAYAQPLDADLTTIAGLPTTKGGLIVGGGSAWVEVPVGVNGSLLVADSTQSAGVRWGGVLHAVVPNNDTITSATYADLANVGPTVSIVTGTRALVTLSAEFAGVSGGNQTYVGFEVSGATTIAASDTTALINQENSGSPRNAYGRTTLVTGLTPGTNVFKMVYRITAGSAGMQNRELIVQAV